MFLQLLIYKILTWPVFAFLLTVAIEWPLLAWWSGKGLSKTMPFAVHVNGLTWGLMMAALILWEPPVPLLEVAVIAAEASLLKLFWRWPWWRAVAVSTGLNLASWLGGSALVQFVIGEVPLPW